MKTFPTDDELTEFAAEKLGLEFHEGFNVTMEAPGYFKDGLRHFDDDDFQPLTDGNLMLEGMAALHAKGYTYTTGPDFVIIWPKVKDGDEVVKIAKEPRQAPRTFWAAWWRAEHE